MLFGFGKRKCKECGVELAEMEAMRDRADDLMKSSALGSAENIANICARCRLALTKSSQSLAMNLHVIEARRIEAEEKPPPLRPAEAPAPPKAEADPAYKPGGGFKTESELLDAGDDEMSFDNVRDLGTTLKWLFTTKAGRNAAWAGFALFIVGVNMCSTDSSYENPDEPVASEAPSTFEPAVDEAEPSPQPPAPIPTAPARPSNNPGSWVTTLDYPARALSEGREGTTGFRVTINAQGAVTECDITAPSGHADLDATTCAAISRRARFERAPVGTPDRGFASRVTWRIPRE